MHIVCADGKHVAVVERMIVSGTERVLYVAVIADVQSATSLIVRLVVLVEGVSHLQVVRVRDVPAELQSTREVAITLRKVCRTCCLAEEIACTCCQ